MSRSASFPLPLTASDRFTASTIMAVVYGYKVAPRNDLFASIADRASDMLANCFFPGAALVNTFPVRASRSLSLSRSLPFSSPKR